MRHYHVDTGREAVFETCEAILAHGKIVSPRGQRTLEVAPLSLTIDFPHDIVPTGISRPKLTPAIGAAEALQNIAGVAAPELMRAISSFFPKASSRWDESVPTYGVRLRDADQLGAVCRKLRDDPDSRQAVALIWRADDPEAGQAHNLCTISLHFMVRDRKLQMYVTMRSNDAWYGLCYDLEQFAAIQCTIAGILGLQVGKYVHTAHSMHLYERHWDVAAELTAPVAADHKIWECDEEGGVLAGSWTEARDRALAILDGRADSLDLGVTEMRWADSLVPYFEKMAETA